MHTVHGLDPRVSISGADPALHRSPAQEARCDRTAMPASMHARDMPTHSVVSRCQGSRTLQLLHCMISVRLLTLTYPAAALQEPLKEYLDAVSSLARDLCP